MNNIWDRCTACGHLCRGRYCLACDPSISVDERVAKLCALETWNNLDTTHLPYGHTTPACTLVKQLKLVGASVERMNDSYLRWLDDITTRENPHHDDLT